MFAPFAGGLRGCALPDRRCINQIIMFYEGLSKPMETRITATELAKGLSDILNRVRYRGDSFVVERNGEDVAVLRPSGPSLGITMREAARRLDSLPSAGADFADDLEVMQAAQPPVGASAWDT